MVDVVVDAATAAATLAVIANAGAIDGVDFDMAFGITDNADVCAANGGDGGVGIRCGASASGGTWARAADMMVNSEE